MDMTHIKVGIHIQPKKVVYVANSGLSRLCAARKDSAIQIGLPCPSSIASHALNSHPPSIPLHNDNPQNLLVPATLPLNEEKVDSSLGI